MTLPICGVLISAWGWESVFYITGLVGILWSVMWFNLVFETPADHPRISEYERHHIEAQIAKQNSPGTKVHKYNVTRVVQIEFSSILNVFYQYEFTNYFILTEKPMNYSNNVPQ